MSGYPSSEQTGGDPKVEILQAKEVAIPIAVTQGGVGGFTVPPEVMQMRADFLAGKQMSREQMGELLRQAAEGGGGNGNCGIC